MTDVFGRLYAPAYDALYREKDYDSETELLERLFRRYVARPVRTVLDLGCGTGNHALRLAASGYEVVGVDRSSEMLALADRKARNRATGVRFHRADLRNVELGESFDSVLMMFAVLGYQIEDRDVRSALQAARRHMNPDGVMIFDFWYGPAVLAQGLERRVRIVKDSGGTWERTSSGEFDRSRNACHVEFLLRRTEGGRLVDETTEHHVMRYFFPREIEVFLSDCGLRLLRLGAFPEFDLEPDPTTWNVIAVASMA